MTFLYWDCSLFDYRKYILMGNIFISCPWYRELIYSVSIYWLYNTVLFQILPKIQMNNYSPYLPWMTCEIDYWEHNFCSLKRSNRNLSVEQCSAPLHHVCFSWFAKTFWLFLLGDWWAGGQLRVVRAVHCPETSGPVIHPCPATSRAAHWDTNQTTVWRARRTILRGGVPHNNQTCNIRIAESFPGVQYGASSLFS